MQRQLICLAAIVLCATAARADGIYISPQYHAKPPPIPSQRAIIVYKDGVERLQVESVVQPQGASLAWVLPVPATPTDMKQASPDFLNALSWGYAPMILGEEYARRGFGLAKTCAVIFGFWALCMLAKNPGPEVAALWLMFAAFVCFMTVPFGGTKSEEATSAAGAVGVEKTSVVGNYDVAVLQAPDAAALDAWLTENQFATLPSNGQAIANDYIKEGWHFVAVKLRSNAGQILRPHPIELTFPAKQPVYPMRLTALADCDVYVELYIVSNGSAQGKGLIQQVVSTLSTEKLFHPDSPQYLWAGCTLTRLDGTLSPAQMDRDIALTLSKPVNFYRTYYTPEARTARAWTVALWAWVVSIIALTFAATFPKAPALRLKCIAFAIPIAGLTAAAAGVVQAVATPVKEATAVYASYDTVSQPLPPPQGLQRPQ